MSASAWIRNSTSIYSRGVRPIPHTFATPNPRPSPGHPSAGVDGLETDVCLTADGALVLLHDPYLPLGTDLKGLEHEARPPSCGGRGCETAMAA